MNMRSESLYFCGPSQNIAWPPPSSASKTTKEEPGTASWIPCAIYIYVLIPWSNRECRARDRRRGGVALDEVGYRGTDHQRVSNRTWRQRALRRGCRIPARITPAGVRGVGRVPTIPSLSIGRFQLHEQPPVAVDQDEPAGTDVHPLQLAGSEHFVNAAAADARDFAGSGNRCRNNV